MRNPFLAVMILLLSSAWAMAQVASTGATGAGNGGASPTGNHNIYATGSSGTVLSPDITQQMTGIEGETVSGATAQSGADIVNPNNSASSGTNGGVSPNGPNSTARGMGYSDVASGVTFLSMNPVTAGAPTAQAGRRSAGKCGEQVVNGTPAYVQGGTICSTQR